MTTSLIKTISKATGEQESETATPIIDRDKLSLTDNVMISLLIHLGAGARVVVESGSVSTYRLIGSSV